MSTQPTTHEVADMIRAATAWWMRAAILLEAGDLEQAVTCARLGEFGLQDVPERIEAVATSHP